MRDSSDQGQPPNTTAPSAPLGQPLSRRDFTKFLGTGVAAAAALPLLKAAAKAKTTSATSTLRAAATSAGKPIKVSFESDETSGWAPIVASYNAKYGASLGTATLVPLPTDTFNEILPRTLAAGTATDIIEVGPGNGEPLSIQVLAPGGYLYDLSHEPWASEIPPKIKDVCSVNGKLYMLPEKGSGHVVFYNKKIFREHNLSVPQSWSQLLAVCSKLKDNKIIPIWLDASSAFVQGLFTIFLTFPLAANTDVADPNWPALRKAGKVSFAKSGWKTSLEKFMTLSTMGFFNPEPTGGASLGLLADGKAAMMCAYPEGFSIYGPPLFGKNNTGVFALPGCSTPATLTAIAGSGYGIAVNAKSPNIAASLEFLNVAADPASITEFVHTIGGIPILPAGATAVNDAFANWVALVRQRAIPMFDQYWPNPYVIHQLWNGTNALLSGQTTIPLVLESMDNAWDEGYV